MNSSDMMDHTGGWMGGWMDGMWLWTIGVLVIVLLVVVIINQSKK